MFGRAFGSIFLSTAILTGCASTTSGRVYVRSGPPPVVVETRARAGAPGLIWVPGYQRWDGRGYVWVPGRYERPPRLHATWVPGRWVHDRRGWYYVDGRWR